MRNIRKYTSIFTGFCREQGPLLLKVVSKLAIYWICGNYWSLEDLPLTEIATLVGTVMHNRKARAIVPISWELVVAGGEVVEHHTSHSFATRRPSGKVAAKETPVRWIVPLLGLAMSFGCLSGPTSSAPHGPSCDWLMGKTDPECGCPFDDPPYLIRCKKCGAECNSSDPPDVSECPNWLQMCDETVGWIMALGNLNELVRHQPGNAQARQRQAECQQMLDEHCRDCPVCRAALGE
jgi:hypothetical protein